MANDIIIQLQNSVAAIQPGVDDDTRAVAGNSGSKRISIDGGVFRKMVGGKQVAEIEDRHMHIILAKMSHNPARTYYSGVYQKGVKSAPACWSNDSQAPDPKVKNPPARSCRECPYSVKGSGNGGVGTACRMSWRTAVVLPNDPSGDVMQLVLPATSVFGNEESGKWPFKAYIQMLANNNISAGRVITKMQFDTKSSVPRLLFSPVGAVPTEDVGIIQRQGNSEAAMKAITLTVYQADEGDVDEVPEPTNDIPEPKVRDAAAAETAATADVSSVISKWKTKK